MSQERRAIQAWMERLAEGDREAFAPLFDALWPKLLGFAQRLLGSEADAADAAQAALVKIFARAHVFDAERDALTWALSIAAYECRTLRGRARRRRETPDGLDAVASEQAEAAIVRRDLERAFIDALGDLSVADRELVAAVLAGAEPELRGPSYRKRLSRALSRLRQIWSSKHDSDG